MQHARRCSDHDRLELLRFAVEAANEWAESRAEASAETWGKSPGLIRRLAVLEPGDFPEVCRAALPPERVNSHDSFVPSMSAIGIDICRVSSSGGSLSAAVIVVPLPFYHRSGCTPAALHCGDQLRQHGSLLALYGSLRTNTRPAIRPVCLVRESSQCAGFTRRQRSTCVREHMMTGRVARNLRRMLAAFAAQVKRGR